MPPALIWIGVPFAAATAALGAELVWEQTVLTWQRGPQMVGWSLGHSGPLLPLAAATAAGAVWLIGFGFTALTRRSVGGLFGIIVASAYLASVGLIAVPYEWWQRASARVLVRGSHVGEFLSLAAARGDADTIEALLAHGASVDARTESGATALHSAALSGREQVVTFLLARGADLNAVNHNGDSPLVVAENSHQVAVSRLLRARGAMWIAGSDSRRDAVVGK